MNSFNYKIASNRRHHAAKNDLEGVCRSVSTVSVPLHFRTANNPPAPAGAHGTPIDSPHGAPMHEAPDGGQYMHVTHVWAFRQSLTVAWAPPSKFDCRSGPSVKFWPSESGRQSLRAGRAPTTPLWTPTCPRRNSPACCRTSIMERPDDALFIYHPLALRHVRDSIDK